MPTPETPILDDSAVSEIEARARKYKQLAERAATPADEDVIRWFAKTVRALCDTVKHLRAENVSLRKEVANSEKYQAQLLDSDSQAATLHYFKDRGDRRCVTCGNLRLWQYHTDEESDPATGMRDKCVEKTRDWLSKAGFDYGPLVRELELLTLQEQAK